VRDRVEIILTRTRSSGYLNLDEAIYRFYAARLLPTEAAGRSPPTKRAGNVAHPGPRWPPFPSSLIWSVNGA